MNWINFVKDHSGSPAVPRIKFVSASRREKVIVDGGFC